MAEKHTYVVLRQHYGDRQYVEGDERELTEAEAKHLVDLGSLRKKRETRKAEAEPANKAERAPANKGR